jgi:hypothetical protein
MIGIDLVNVRKGRRGRRDSLFGRRDSLFGHLRPKLI